jgi:hypothetical protein
MSTDSAPPIVMWSSGTLVLTKCCKSRSHESKMRTDPNSRIARLRQLTLWQPWVSDKVRAAKTSAQAR